MELLQLHLLWMQKNGNCKNPSSVKGAYICASAFAIRWKHPHCHKYFQTQNTLSVAACCFYIPSLRASVKQVKVTERKFLCTWHFSAKKQACTIHALGTSARTPAQVHALRDNGNSFTRKGWDQQSVYICSDAMETLSSSPLFLLYH